MLNKIIYTILGIGLALVFYPHPALDSVKKQAVSGASTSASAPELKSAPEMAVNLSAPSLTAKSALAFDVDSGTILYSNNLDEKLPIASLTKLMTALVVLKQTPDLNAAVIISKSEQGVVGSTIGLVAGETISVDNLLHALLISSSNDAAVALADFAGGQERFAELMNKEAFDLGLNQTKFSNPVGWDIDENYSNTLDLTKIVREVLKYPELREIVKTKQMTISSIDGRYVHELRTTNKLLIDDPNVVGIKTGFTSKALGNLIILSNHDGGQVVTIVLGSTNREEDTLKLLDWLFTVYRW